MGAHLVHLTAEDAEGATATVALELTVERAVRTFDDPTPTGGDGFGFSVAIGGNQVLVGAREDDTQGAGVGQAHLFELSSGEK